MQRYLAILFLGLFVALSPIEAHAESVDIERANANIQPKPPGPVVAQGTAAFDSSGTQASANSHTIPRSASPGSPSVTFVPVPNNVIVVTGAPWVDQFGIVHQGPGLPANACPAGQTGFFVLDQNGINQGVLCVPTDAAAAPAASALQLAQQASARQPWPSLVVGVSPAVGLTGLPAWFWLAGGSAQMPDATASASGITVTVRATLIGVVWSFGDHATFDSGTDLGQAFPAPSRVQHVYETDTRALVGGYQVTALLRFRVTYSVNGAPFTELGVKARPYTATYVVNQLQPQAVNAR